MTNAAYVTVDVFTSERFAGNPLAVFPDARGLSDEAMQKIAAEFNYSEVTFVLPPEDPANSARVRIFTPTMEIPFAGHPNVGTAFVLGQRNELFGSPVGDTLRFEEKAGLVDVKLHRKHDVVVGAAIRAPRKLTVGRSVAAELVARCASLDAAAIRLSTHAPVFASVGLPFVLAEVDGLDALAAARPNAAIFAEAADGQGNGNHDFSLFLYTRSTDRPWQIRARMFAPLDNVTEDPATGSASAALGAYLVSLLPDADAKISITIEQGVEMGRRSMIELVVQKSSGEITDVEIAGRCVDVMQGTIRL
ncbi:PhzF family phenazine biosynthesis protein [Rhizobium sp. BK376]|uniref:PhzF family phenazine biosynthesis protein n=1 Tax=Rhizobium sp. BK376 TaxID=2512149 RepID=UPI001043403A|nr:PhzF family phenazine biosynthesis protein [Rhizobium sp. BK376]TCR91651.1 trans-2,3-dihydro-3-hydroxyanthranilate isomerase [Rhizobium sp. BK376]